MNHPAFVEGKYDTHFIEKYGNELQSNIVPCDQDCEDLAVITTFIDYLDKLHNQISNDSTSATIQGSPWQRYGQMKSLVRI